MKVCPKNNLKCNLKLDEIQSTDSISKVNSFFERTFPHMKNDIPLWNDFIFKNGKTYILKEPKGDIVGLVNIENKERSSWLNFLGVDPKYQHLGIGKKLLDIAETKTSKILKSTELNLYTEGNKLRNLNFYLKNGFTIKKIDEKGYEHTTSVHFKKHL